MSNHKHPIRILKIIKWIITAFAVGLIALIAMNYTPPNGNEHLFEYNNALKIDKETSDGIKYSINNSFATFYLDIASPDKHCKKLFPDYEAALQYCRNSDLPVIPSVQLIQGKCKQFDDGLSAALELAVQQGFEKDIIGKHDALSKLLDSMLKLLTELPESRHPPVESAIIHVGTALSLGGSDLHLESELGAGIQAKKKRFLSQSVKSQPVGFWTWNNHLKSVFRQDRYLSQGFSIAKNTPVYVIFAAIISRDEELAHAFRRLREFDGKLTNPPVYIDPDKAWAAPAYCISIDDFSDVAPDGMTIEELLDPAILEKIKTGLLQRFKTSAGFALVSYSSSKEYNLLVNEKIDMGKNNSMQLIIDAIKSGRILLEPKPDSGWYDYQWHALETLLLHNRARESEKLELSAAYKKRLENAFKTSLTKHRETHIKHLPYLIAGCNGSDSEKKPKVKIGPEFTAEPTATVYLRYARGYRFLENAMHATLGKDFLKQLHRKNANSPPVKMDIDTELRYMALLCYGLYERLCPEIGQTPKYLPGEMSKDDINAAKKTISEWLSSLQGDSDLGRDTRIAVPILYWPGGPVRYWATGGISLERVVCKYNEEPEIFGSIEPVFTPTYYYLPTDIFLEFEQSADTLLTRDKFRSICNQHKNEKSLRKELGAIEAKQGGNFLVYIAIVIMLIVAGFTAHRFRKKLFSMNIRRISLTIIICTSVLLILWIAALKTYPAYRTRVLVKVLAALAHGFDGSLVAGIESIIFRQCDSLESVTELTHLIADQNPQVRYNAVRLLVRLSPSFGLVGYGRGEKYIRQIPELENTLRAAVDDEVFEVASYSALMLGSFKNDANTELLISRLKSKKHIGFFCENALRTLGRSCDSKALDTILSFTNDNRDNVRNAAFWFLFNFNDQRAAQRLAELVLSGDEKMSNRACTKLRWLFEKFPHPSWEDQFNTTVLEYAGKTEFSAKHRLELAHHITRAGLKADAYLAILRSPEHGKTDSVSKSCTDAVFSLSELGHSGIPGLREALKYPDPDVQKAASKALENILSTTGKKEE